MGRALVAVNNAAILHLVDPIAGFRDQLIVSHEKKGLVPFLDEALQ
jgi:hypothetical protein